MDVERGSRRTRGVPGVEVVVLDVGVVVLDVREGFWAWR